MTRRPCDGFCDACEGESAVATLRDTSSGQCPPAIFCATCAKAYDEWVRQYDGESDGEAWSGGFAANH